MAQPSAPRAHRITSDAEALGIARELAAQFAAGAVRRDAEPIAPVANVEAFSNSGLWSITVPKAFGGAGVTNVTVVDVIKTISVADPSIGQIPQNHFALK